MVRSILIVCTGNICRSPTADGIMRKMAADQGVDLIIDSAGTHAYHVGEAPDPRTQHVAKARGYDVSELRARKVTRDDFDDFDLILAMDAGHLHALKLMQPKQSNAELALFCEYAGLGKQDVADPYFGGAKGFEQCFDLVKKASQLIIDKC